LTMSQIVRTSKLRHVFADAPRREDCWENFRLSSTSADQDGVKTNGVFFAIPVKNGGGSIAVHRLDQPGRLEDLPPLVDVAGAGAQAFEWNPFHQNFLASATETVVQVWRLPEAGLQETISDPISTLAARFQRAISTLKFHPAADHLLGVGSAEGVVKLWDVQAEKEQISIEKSEGGKGIHEIAWSYTGSRLAVADKAHLLKLYDPRSSTDPVDQLKAHDGARPVKLTYMGKKGKLMSAGASRQGMRQCKIWDPRKFKDPVSLIDVDIAAGALLPLYDEDLNVLYLSGKGDATIRYYEFVGDQGQFINEYLDANPCRGADMIPKRFLDTNVNEVARILKLSADVLEPISFICPRRADTFQADLYPDTNAGTALCSADEWFENKKKIIKPRRMTLDPVKKKKENRFSFARRTSIRKVFEKKKSPEELKQELDKAKKYIRKLLRVCMQNDIVVPS